MKRLFLVSLFIAILSISCRSYALTDVEVIREGYQKKGVEAQAVYSSYAASSPRVMYNLAYSYLENNEVDIALSLALEAEAEYPRYIRFYYLEAYCYRNLNDNESYIKALEKILSIDKGNIEIREMLIGCYVDMNLEGEAIREAKALLYIDSKNTVALNALSLYIPFYQELTGYSRKEEKIREYIDRIKEIEWLRIKPELNKLGALLTNKGIT